MPFVFISYRRADSQDATRAVYQALQPLMGKGSLFFDNANTRDNGAFDEALITTVSRAKVILVIIGNQWLTELQTRNLRGNEWVRNPDDWVLREIETALSIRGAEIIPVLLNGAAMPHPNQLPPTIYNLSRQHAARLSTGEGFEGDIDELVRRIRLVGRPRRWLIYAMSAIGLAILALMAVIASAGWCLNCPPSAIMTPTPSQTHTAELATLQEQSAPTETETPTVTATVTVTPDPSPTVTPRPVIYNTAAPARPTNTPVNPTSIPQQPTNPVATPQVGGSLCSDICPPTPTPE